MNSYAYELCWFSLTFVISAHVLYIKIFRIIHIIIHIRGKDIKHIFHVLTNVGAHVCDPRSCFIYQNI